jgi:osmotically-inducible protein OsmY
VPAFARQSALETACDGGRSNGSQGFAAPAVFTSAARRAPSPRHPYKLLKTIRQACPSSSEKVWSGDCQIEGVMKNNALRKISRIGWTALLFTLCASAQQHKWAGRSLDNFEWDIHERLAAVPHGVFDTLNFEARGKMITLSGQVLKDSVRQNALRAVRRVEGVEKVVDRIEVLPSSRRDDALRTNVYRAVYEKEPLEKYGARADPPVHIIVKYGWVTLEGVVDSDAERSLVHRRALQATAHVSDHLRVAAQEE